MWRPAGADSCWGSATQAASPSSDHDSVRRRPTTLALPGCKGDAGSTTIPLETDSATTDGTDATDTDAGTTGVELPDYEQPGPHPVGNVRFTVEDSASIRSLLV